MAGRGKKKKKTSASGSVARGRNISRLKKKFTKNPASEEDFVKLWDVYLAAEAWEALAELLEARIAALTDGADKVRALLRLGNLYDEKLGEPRRAVDAYQRVLNIEPRNRRAIWSLAMLYHDLEEWNKVIEIYLLQIDLAESPEEKLSLRTQLAQIYEERLQQDDEALLEYIRAVRLAPETVRILLNMEKLAFRTASFRELLAVYLDVVERVERLDLKIAIYLKLARLHAEHLDDSDAAENYFRRALEVSGDDTEKLFAISSIYGEDEEWEELIAIYSVLIGLADSPATKNRLRREIARLYAEGLNDPSSAFFELVRVARYSPQDPGLLEQLCELGRQADRHLELAAVLEDLATRIQDEHLLAELYSRLARIHLDDLHNADLAEQAVARAIEILPGNQAALLTRLDILEASKDFASLAQALESFLSLPDLDDDLARQQRRRLARVLEEKLGQHDRAVELYRSALEQDSSTAAAGQRREDILEQLYRRQGTYQELVELLARRLQQTDDADEACRLALEIADIQKSHLEQPQAAFYEIARACRRLPGHEQLLEALLALADENDMHQQALALLDDLSQTAGEPAAARVRRHLRRVLLALGQEEQVEQLLLKTVAENPDDADSFAELQQLLQQRNDWRRLAELLLQRASSLEPGEEKIEMFYQAAETIEDELGDLGWAAEVFERILALEPTATAARKSLQRLRREAAEMAELQDDPTIPDGSASGMPPVANGEEASADPTREDREPTQVTPPPGKKESRPQAAMDPAPEGVPSLEPEYEPELEHEPEPEYEPEPGTVTETAAPEESPPAPGPEPNDVTGDDDRPTTDEATQPFIQPDSPRWLRQYLARQPDDIVAWDKLSQLVADDEGPGAAFDLLEQALDSMHTHEEGLQRLFRRMSFLAEDAERHVRLGRIMQQRGWVEGAESAYRAALRQEPANQQALDGLHLMYQEKDALDRYEAIVSRALRAARDPESRRNLRLRRARLRAVELGRLTDALDDLDRLVSVDGGDLEALQLQEKLLEKNAMYEQLAGVYQRHLQLLDDPSRRFELHLALASLAESKLDDLTQAEQQLRAAIGINPQHIGAHEALARLLERRRDWLGAVETLRQAAERDVSGESLGRLRFWEGRILEEQLLRPEEAERAYRQALEVAEPSVDALEALRGMAQRREDWVEAIALGQQQAELMTDNQARADLWAELGGIWKKHLDNSHQALECYERAYRLWPQQVEAARQVAEARLQKKDHGQAHQLLARLARDGAQQDLDPVELAAINLKLAQSAEAIDLPEEAEQAYERALELDPQDTGARLQYAYHLSRRNKWERAVEVLDSLLEQQRHRLDPESIADTYCLMARGLSQLGRPDEASKNLEQALKANPEHLPALRAALELANQMGRHRLAAEKLEHLVEVSQVPRERQAYLLLLAELSSDRLADHERAATLYQEALEAEPNNVELLDRLRKVLVKADRQQEAVDVLKKLAHLSSNERQRARFLRIAGDIARERLDDDRQALELYLRALRSSPLDRRSHNAAVKILNRLRDWPRLATLYEELLARLPPPIPGQADLRQDILQELVELYRFRLQDAARASQACEQLLSLQPTNLKVREDLARLYEMTGRLDDSLSVHRSLITESPFSVDSYHALRRIYEQQHDTDGALCVAATLSFLDEANEDEQQLLRQHRHALAIPPGRRIDERLYQKRLVAPLARGVLGEIFLFASEFARLLFVKDHRELRLRQKERLDLDDADSSLARLVREALSFLMLPEPEVYLKGGLVKGALAVNTSPPAIVISEEAFRRSTAAELRFMLGRAAAFSRPENLLAASLSPGQLRTLLAALIELAQPGEGLEIDDDAVELTHKLDKRIPAGRRNHLKELAQRYRKLEGDLTIRDWLEGIEHTCNRAGFLLCGDLEAAVQVLKGARVLGLTGSHRTLIRELIFYSISEDFLSLRREIKAAVE